MAADPTLVEEMARMPSEIEKLVERLLAATGPDRQLDCAIAAAVFSACKHPNWYHFQNQRPKDSPERSEAEFWLQYAPFYTRRRDARLPIEDDGFWRIEGPVLTQISNDTYGMRWIASFIRNATTTAVMEHKGVAPTEALARRIAALRARQAPEVG